jgi:hypothetical protein
MNQNNGNIFSRKEETLEFFENINKDQLKIRVAKFIYKSLKGIEEFDKPLSKVSLTDLNDTSFPFEVATYYNKLEISDFLYGSKSLDIFNLRASEMWDEQIDSPVGKPLLIVFRTTNRKLQCLHYRRNYLDGNKWSLSRIIGATPWFVQPFDKLMETIKGTM